jgi:superfamily II DNA or RNA helicase
MPTDGANDKNSLAALSLKRSYRSSDDPLDSFYIPCLSRAIQYDRAAGFFDSRSLSIGARGVAGLIKNGGKMRLLTSPRFSDKDLEVISDVISEAEQPSQSDSQPFDAALDSALHRGLEAEEFEQYLQQDRFRCLAWLLKEGLLEIRIAFMPEHPGMSPYRMYHEKIGLIADEHDNEVAFTGSINETAAGWTENYESFDVYRSWCGEQDRIADKRAAFARLWENEDEKVEVRELPASVESIIVEQSPDTIDGLPALDIFFTEEGGTETGDDDSLDLWDHQRDAIDWWKEHEYKGIFAMATGTGKTFTALRAARLEADTRLTVVVVPTQILIDQWHDEIQDVFGEETLLLECTGGTGWRDEILQIVDVYREGSLESVTSLPRTVLLTTPHTASSEAFQRALRHIDPPRLQMIIDEVHNVGAPTFQRILDVEAGRRIGLSATPDRKWDEEGTNAIYSYFGGHDPFRFETKEAIDNGYLSPYEYHPIVCHLAPGEYDEFKQLTTKIKQQSAVANSSDDPDSQDHLERLLQQRARIKKGAVQKPTRFGEFLDMDHPIPAIVFCEDTEQLEDIQTELDERNLRYGVYISDREAEQGAAFHKFETGAIDYLLAIRCLDEGVDVPDCPTAVLISSSTNERQYIQRRGRVLRTSAGKEQAAIYDMLVFPGVQAAAGEDAAMTLINQELDRAKLLMKAAMNREASERQLAKELDSYDKDISYLAYV